MFWELFWSFLKIGAFTFGGGYAMIPLIQGEVVNKKKWLEETEFVDLLAISQSFPGPLALNTSILVGARKYGIKGGLVAAIAIALPSFIVILAIALVFTEFRHQPYVEKVFMGMRPAVVGLIAAPLYKMGKSAGINWKNCWIPIVVAILVWQFKLSPVYIVLVAILMGLIIKKWRKK